MKAQLRMLIAEWLMGKAMSIAPDTEEGRELKYYVLSYMTKAMEKTITEIQRKRN